MYGNFKVKCVDNGGCYDCYTEGKIYETKDGIFTMDNGSDFKNVENFTNLCKRSSARWELVEETEIKVGDKVRIKKREDMPKVMTVGFLEEMEYLCGQELEWFPDDIRGQFMRVDRWEIHPFMVELIEEDTDINVDDKNEHCLECQPNHKSCNTCFFYEEEESEYPCNTCVSGAGDNEMYVKGAGCHNCGRTFEVENIVNSLNQTITKLENEIAELKEHLKAQLPEEKTAIDLLNEKETQLIADANKKTLQQEFYKQGYLQGLEDMHRQIREVLRDKGIE